MTWFRVDDSFHDHPKVRGLSDSAVALWVRTGCWSARHLTDGEVPAGVARELCSVQRWRSTCAALVKTGLWAHDAERDVYSFHDWDDYNPTGDIIKKRRRANAARQTAHRLGRTAGPNGVSHAVTGTVTGNAGSDGVTNAVADDARSVVSHSAPSRPLIGDRRQPGERFARARDDDDDGQPCQDDELSDIAVAMAMATGRTITRDQARQVRARVLEGRSPSNPQAYVIAAIRNAEDPRRLIPVVPPSAAVPAAAPVGDVLRAANSPDGVQRRFDADVNRRGIAMARELLGIPGPGDEPDENKPGPAGEDSSAEPPDDTDDDIDVPF